MAMSSIRFGRPRQAARLAGLLRAGCPVEPGLQSRRHGILDITRGQVSVVSRDRLLAVACECYAIIKTNYDQVGR
jgi:hypothetical protein